MSKKLLCAVMLTLMVVCAFASCGGNDDVSGNTTHTHNYGEWETTKSATCTTEGAKERYCSCGEKQTASIAKLEHSYGEWETIKEATFAENGEKKRSCKCGSEELETLKFTSGTVTKAELVEYVSIACEKMVASDRLKVAAYYDGHCSWVSHKDYSNGTLKYYLADFDHYYFENWYTNENGYIKIIKNDAETYYTTLTKNDFESSLEDSNIDYIFFDIENKYAGIGNILSPQMTSITATAVGDKIRFVIEYADNYMAITSLVFENGFIKEMIQGESVIKFDCSESLEIPDISNMARK